MLSRSLIAVCILLCDVGFVRTDSEEDGYSGEVKRLFGDTFYKDVNGINKAKLKMDKFSSENWDKKYAIAIINLYTQGGNFYRTLNEQMRNNYPVDTHYWRKAGDLINRGLDILGQKVYDKVYRGCPNATRPIAGKEYRFNQVTSTSLDKTIAENFVKCGFLFTIEDVYGVNVENYSALPHEREKIIKSTNVFLIKKGPVKESIFYDVYYLDGQSSVHCNIRKKRDVNGDNNACVSGAHKTGTETVSIWTVVVVLVLLF
ncbi:uncharacterized protein LOC123538745 isoform X2 [Mercenaria mercenaria]|uniref:uncharacterized protein LOC123538745 isoform X2 n=1 Tax=Mercenaria mercenaria TaxID=6596 RepID=UPI00234EED54|nr:uncharacterized protein LOC123538745 isoform X2 [Mercenaria mercenaria]